MKNQIVALVLAVSLLCTGCVTTQGTQLVAQAAVSVATVRVINGDFARAGRVQVIASAVRAVAGSEKSESVALLDDFIRSKIGWSRLAPEEVVRANMLLDAIRFELEARVGTGTLTGTKLLVVAQVAGWVESAASTVQPKVFNPHG